jgi:hypothetical protein
MPDNPNLVWTLAGDFFEVAQLISNAPAEMSAEKSADIFCGKTGPAIADIVCGRLTLFLATDRQRISHSRAKDPKK